ncbi:MAG TPA: hypothetical protein ENI46_02985 [Firmicutes bacterium]|nr:hypothetical protein [Bacillota bacterium]
MIPGLDPEKRASVSWKPAWQLSSRQVSVISVLVILLLFGVFITVAMRNTNADPEAVFYAFVLFSLICLPHMERYNHVLLLPAMAWLWRRGINYHIVAVGAYSLVGLSRLNHVWAMLLGWPSGPIATGGSLYALLLLYGALLYSVRLPRSNAVAAT